MVTFILLYMIAIITLPVANTLQDKCGQAGNLEQCDCFTLAGCQPTLIQGFFFRNTPRTPNNS